jgi:hypothetical protein
MLVLTTVDVFASMTATLATRSKGYGVFSGYPVVTLLFPGTNRRNNPNLVESWFL